MTGFEELVKLGRNMKAFGGSKRGGLIQLEGRVAYLTNTKRSVMYKITFPEALGTGTFYAGEAPTMSRRTERRDDQVLFEWDEARSTRRVLIADQRPFKELAEEALERWYVEPTIRVPEELFGVMDSNMLMTQFYVEGNELMVRQDRSDGSVSFENVLRLGRGLLRQDYPKAGEVNFFTSDMYVLSGLSQEMYLSLEKATPISLRCRLGFGELVGLISCLEYEE